MTLTEVGDALRATPMAWKDIPQAYRAIAQDALLPQPFFADAQAHWFARWWLACTQADVDAINAMLPAFTQVSPIQWQGGLYLGSDLLTDSLVPGQLYSRARDIVQSLVCTYFDPPPTPA